MSKFRFGVCVDDFGGMTLGVCVHYTSNSMVDDTIRRVGVDLIEL